MLETKKILEAALEGITKYVDQYNEENESYVAVGIVEGSSDHGEIYVDGGDVDGAWALTLGEL